MSKFVWLIGLLALLGPVPPSLAADGGPEVRRLGKTVTQYRDGTVRAVISTKFAANHLDRVWTVLEFCVSAETGKPVVIARGDVSLVAEDGSVMPLPSQRTMAEGMPDVRNVLHTAETMAEPVLGYFPFADMARDLRFFAIPGDGIVLDEEVVDRNRIGHGWLFFRSSSGRWGGLYQLVIGNRETNVKIPFRLPPGDLPEKESDPKVVPW